MIWRFCLTLNTIAQKSKRFPDFKKNLKILLNTKNTIVFLYSFYKSVV
ncbi:hypothetical protein ELI_1990 [Eubacterium callanderi]|uniref:Uncharacterized protein n=1 Tax=Eubacterium callanderi TaxID=53442 RepID=E3GDP3_9FIRM|nr:hypothetical protein ELI_1990 [Eubacterium callanderi]